MYKGLGRCPASSSCSTVGIDMGGRGIADGIGDGGRGSAESGRGVGVAFEAEPAKLPPISRLRLRGGGRGSGWKELRRLDDTCVGAWVLDFRRRVGGVDSVLVYSVGLPGGWNRPLGPSDCWYSLRGSALCK